MPITGTDLDVKMFGAVGDSVTDDTAAIQAAFDYLGTLNYGSLRFPAGSYITTHIDVELSGTQYDVFGEGAVIGHAGDDALFYHANASRPTTWRDIKILSTAAKTSSDHAAFFYEDGCTKARFVNMTYGGVSGGVEDTGASFFNCHPQAVCDEVWFENCEISNTGIGIGVGPGSSIWVTGTRIKGLYHSPTVGAGPHSTGVHLYGGNGGVYAIGSDIIGHRYGWRNTDDNGASNREVFLTHTSLDGCYVGWEIGDSSWNGAAQIWAHSCLQACVAFGGTSDFATLNISGGIIGNGGVSHATADQGWGLVMNGRGRMHITGVTFRENDYRAIDILNGVSDVYSTIEHCQFYDNGGKPGAVSQVVLAGKVIFRDNYINASAYGTSALSRDSSTASQMRIANNQGVGGFGVVADPTIGASGTAKTNNTGYDATLYARGGAVYECYVNGIQVHNFNGGNANASYFLRAGDTFRFDYTNAPTIDWFYH